MPHNSASRDYRDFRLVLAAGRSALLAAVLLLPATTGPALSQSVVVVDVDVKDVARGYRASELTGKDVQNSLGETIGSVDDFIVDREKVLFAILQIGGFLGIGGFLVAIPYNSLEISADGSTILLSAGSKEDLQKLPEFKYEKK